MLSNRSNPIAALAVLALAACAGVQSIVPQQSTLPEVRDRMGRPTDIRFDRDGNELWEYATGPMGYQTYLVRAARDGRVLDVSALITQAQFEKVVRNSSTKTQVRELLGMPSEVQYFGADAVWSWRMAISPQRGYYSVRFDPAGIAVETLVIMDASGDDRDRDRGDRGGRGGRGR
jgi:outer membrane protein assembly factor BamE (lipoprotein component of BamABCDE complex)